MARCRSCDWGELYDPSHGINRPQTVFSLVFLRLFSVPPMAIQYFRRPPSFDNDSHEMNNRNPRFHRDRDVPDDDGDDAGSDMSDDLVEVSNEEIPGYFSERGGRLFHSHGRSPYPLPVDAEEHEVSRAEGPGGTHGAAPGRLRPLPSRSRSCILRCG